MKKIILSFLIITICVCLCSCGNSDLNVDSPDITENNTVEVIESEENRQPADAVMLSELYGTWNGSRWDEYAPVAIITFNEDGTCEADGQEMVWEAWSVSDSTIEIEASKDGEAIVGGRFSVHQEGENSWNELRLWDAKNYDPNILIPAPSYGKVVNESAQ